VLALSRALPRAGTPPPRLGGSPQKVCTKLDLAAGIFTTPTAFIMSFGGPTELKSRLLRVEGGELDMGKLAQVDALVDDVLEREVTPEAGTKKLAEIIAGSSRFGRGLSTFVHGVTSGGMAVFFGGSVHDVLVAGGIGRTLGLLAQYMKRSTDQARVFELVGAAFVAFAAAVISSATTKITPSLVTLAALVVLLPGLSLTVAMNELATRHMIAGTARLMSAVIVLLELVMGVALGDRIAHAFVVVHQATPVPLPEWSNWLALGAASISIAIVVQAQVRAFGWIVAGCVVGYLGTRLGTLWLDSQLGVLVGAFALGVLANVYARLLDRPAMVVSVPAMLLLVPGGMGFRGMASLLDRDTLTGVDTLFAMLIVAMAIAGGLLVATAVVSPQRSL